MKSLEQIERRIEIVFANVFRALLVITIVGSVFTQNWENLFTGVLTLGLTYLPFLIADRNHVILPSLFQLVILMFLFAAMYLGEIGAFFLRFWWWDIALHTSSGMILGIIGFFMIYFLNQKEQVGMILSSGFIVFFAFAFAITVGVVWEIFEFALDSIFGLNMQKSGLADTMWDLIINAFGALITCIAGYSYVKKERRSMFRRFARMIVRQKVAT